MFYGLLVVHMVTWQDLTVNFYISYGVNMNKWSHDADITLQSSSSQAAELHSVASLQRWRPNIPLQQLTMKRYGKDAKSGCLVWFLLLVQVLPALLLGMLKKTMITTFQKVAMKRQAE